MSNSTGAALKGRQIVDAEGVALFHHAFGGSNAIHVDAEAAKALGGVVQHGIRTLFPALAYLLCAAPAGSKASIIVDAKFLAPVTSGDVIDTTLVEGREGSAPVTQYEVSASNAAGVKVLAATAEVRPR